MDSLEIAEGDDTPSEGITAVKAPAKRLLYHITNHVIDRFVERYGHKFKSELRSGVNPFDIVQGLLREAVEDASVFSTRKGFTILEKYPSERVRWLRNGSLIFVLVGTGDAQRIVTCYEY